MSGLRTAHAAIAFIGGLVLGLLLFGASGRGINALVALTFILLAWSLENLRVAILTRAENRS